jgi:hypothetical protein
MTTLIIVLFVAARPAYAYVDPGTGGMLAQLLTGGVAGLLIVLRLYWSRIKRWFGGGRAATHRVARGDADEAQRQNDRL